MAATPTSPEEMPTPAPTTTTTPQIETDAEAAVTFAAAAEEVTAPPATPLRPTVLLLAPELDAATTSAVAGSADAATAAISPSASSCGSISPCSSNAAAAALSAISPSSSFLPEMPQWKRDLIQRRKSNVARTNAGGGAAQAPTSPLSPSLLLRSPSSPLSDHHSQSHHAASSATAATASNADGFMKSPRKDFTLKTTTVYPAQNTATTTKVSSNSKHATSQQENATMNTTAAAAATTIEQQLQKNAKTYSQTTTTATKMPATNTATTTNSPTKSPTPTAAAIISTISPTKEKSEKFIGGHYTPSPPPLTAKDQNERIAVDQRRGGDLREQQQQQKLLTPSALSPTKSTAPIPKQRSLFLASAAPATATTNTTAKSQTKEQQQQDTASSFPTTSAGTTNTNTNTSTNIAQMSEKRAMQTPPPSPTTTTTTTTRLTSSATLRERERGEHEYEFNEMHETETTRKPKSGTYANSSSTTSPTQQQQQQQRMQSTATPATTGAHATLSSPLQSHSNNESERTLSSSYSSGKTTTTTTKITNSSNNNNSNVAAITTTLTLLDSNISSSSVSVVGSEKTAIQHQTGTISNPAATISCKISNKLQNNQFIKNQQNSASLTSATTNKYIKYKSHSVQDSSASPSVPSTTPTTPGAASSATTFTTTPTGSPTKTPTTTCAIKKKMVAVQEMKKTTQNTSNSHHHPHHHNHHSHHRHHQQQQQQHHQQQRRPSQIDESTPAPDFDASEDLSYGPGIVSKLRCRYLSLALRESLEKERHCLDNLRRATSLNNLLDRDDHHRNEDEDEDDDINEEHEHYGDEVIDIGIRSECAKEANGGTNGKFKSGILKQLPSPQPMQESSSSSLVSKKTATFQKYAVVSAGGNNNTNGGTSARMSQSANNTTNTTNGSGTVTDAAAAAMRSRHFKRGNDSLKRARSVEALLCEKSPWNFALQRTSFDPNNAKQSGGGGGAGSPTSPLSAHAVTIEDKIHNARERLILGTDTMPPKRLTSIIDDTERPPPDLVKQTLKLFEATANRRPRPNRSNSKGDVASKVANYKSIIKENKPAIVFPKPPTSPTKKLSGSGGAVRQQTTVKPMLAAADLISSPVGRKTIGAAGTPTSFHGDMIMAPQQQHASSTPKHKIGVGSAAFLSEQSPDIIPRHNNHKLLAEKSELTSASSLDSPVTALTKKLEKLRIDSDKQQQQAKQNNSGGGGIGTNNSVTIKEFNAKHQQSKLTIETTNNEVNNDANDKFVGGDAAAAGGGDDKNDRAAVVVSTGAAASSSSSTPAPPPAPLVSLQAGTAASSSDLSDDEYGQPTTKSKRITKSALDNIAKAGTTQQFKFAGGPATINSITKSPSLTNSNNSGNSTNLTSNLYDSTTHANNHPDIPTSLLQAVAPGGKQIGVIRPLLTTTTHTATSNSNQNFNSNNQQHHHHHHMETLKQQSNYTQHTTTASSSAACITPSIGSSFLSSPATPQQQHTPPLTSREIEKNRINEMKKTALAEHPNASAGIGGASSATAAIPSACATTSLDTVINTNAGKAAGVAAAAATSSPVASGFSELDAASIAGTSNSPLWALRKKRQPPAAVAENTSMVFNFSNRKEVPDYIENDGVIFRRKRELPKPNESGFVLLGDLSLETSTDSDCDDFSMCPPSPCDVEFENSNIVIDGKSSIRQRPKEATFRVQFNDTLTSTFEYPSEASLIVDDSFNDHYANADDLVSAYQNLMLEDPSVSPAHHPHQHHHVAVDEIIQLPTQNVIIAPANTATTTTAAATNATTPSKNMLGNLPLGSAPLGFYSPVKAPIDNLFQLGVTRAPNGNGHAYNTPPSATTAAAVVTNGIGTSNGVVSAAAAVGSGSIVGISDGTLNGGGSGSEEPESLQYLKPANDDLTIAYSEGATKTDLLY